MKIMYTHSSEPKEVRVHDTEESLRGCIGLVHALGCEKSQEEWDQHVLSQFNQDLAKGTVLSYSIVEEATK